MESSPHVFFKEEQRLSLWLRILLAVTLILFQAYTAVLVVQLLRNPDPQMTTGLWVAGGGCWVLGVAGMLSFLTLNLVTEVRGNRLSVRLFPAQFSWHRVDLDSVVRCEETTYHPWRLAFRYLGWGVLRDWHGQTRGYRIGGNRGVRLEYADGTHLLIGSQCPEELAHAIQSLLGPQ